MRKDIKIFSLLLFLVLLTAYTVRGQVKGESGLKWYSWNASVGFLMPVDPFRTTFSGEAGHAYQFSGTPGFTYSLGKPITLQLVVGAELEDHRIDGTVSNYLSPGDNRFYNARLRTYSLYSQYYASPEWKLNPFILVKAGYSGINRALGHVDLSRTIPANLWQFIFTAGTGVTYHLDPNFSFNLYGEFSPVSDKYLRQLLKNVNKRNLPMARIVFSITGHTDIRVFYPFSRGRGFSKKYGKPADWPFYNKHKR